jgi:hypothetical protein
MAASIPFAKLIGPILLVAALAMLANPKDLLEIAREFLKSRALIYVTGVLAMLGGLAIVKNHNVWVANWPVIITLLGWALVIGGAFRIALPSAVQSIGGAMLERPAVIRIAGAVWVLIAALLTYKGYFPAR